MENLLKKRQREDAKAIAYQATPPLMSGVVSQQQSNQLLVYKAQNLKMKTNVAIAIVRNKFEVLILRWVVEVCECRWIVHISFLQYRWVGISEGHVYISSSCKTDITLSYLVSLLYWLWLWGHLQCELLQQRLWWGLRSTYMEL